MSNINKIRLSGTTYSIQDLNATKTVELTQAEYDALSPKDPNTFYIITDATAGDLSNYYTKSETSGATEISTALESKADTATTYTKTETDNAITAATSTKQDTLVSGTNIKTINGETLLGEGNITIQGGSGGGKAIEAGIGIAITTGETADTVSLNVINQYYGTVNLATSDRNVYNGSIMIGRSYIDNRDHAIAIGTTQREVNGGAKIYGNGGIGIGNNVIEKSRYGIAIGSSSSAGTSDIQFACCAIGAQAESYGNYSTALSRTKVNNESEFGSGKYNVSSTASTTFGDSGNTLFSVGNGTADNARHNAFEIRQNGDIYISNTNDTSTTNYYEKPMIKLQDALGGGGGGSITIDPSLDTGSTNPVANSAITNAIYNQTARFDGYASDGYLVSISSREDGNAISISGMKIKTSENSIAQNASATWLYTSTINGKKALSKSSSNTKDFNLVETSAITTSVTSSSTDAQVPSAKAVYDIVGNIETLLSKI